MTPPYQDPDQENLEHEDVYVRGLKPSALDAVIRLDAKNTGKRREEYFKVKLQQNLQETGVKISLAAEIDKGFVGFLLARVFYGEFGETEPIAVLDTIGVNPDFKGKGVGHALLKQLHMNLSGLGVSTLRTEVSWDTPELLLFFQKIGFRPAPRFCLDAEVKRT